MFLSKIVPQEVLQADLFGDYSSEREYKKARLMVVVDLLNRWWGNNTLFFGAQGIGRAWKMRQERRSPPYTTRKGISYSSGRKREKLLVQSLAGIIPSESVPFHACRLVLHGWATHAHRRQCCHSWEVADEAHSGMSHPTLAWRIPSALHSA